MKETDILRTFRYSVSKQHFVLKLNIGKRAFSVVVLTIWNYLHITIKSYESMATFRKKVEIYLFEIAFHRNCLAVPYSIGDSYLSAFMITRN